jgi:hypothetical protein
MRINLTALIPLAQVLALGLFASAQGAEADSCSGVWPEAFPLGQPFILSDPRSGLSLSLERDEPTTERVRLPGRWGLGLPPDSTADRGHRTSHDHRPPLSPVLTASTRRLLRGNGKLG